MRRTVLVGVLGAGLAVLVSAATVYDIYRVQPGDTLDSIARTYHLSVAELRDLNPGLGAGPLTESQAVTVPVRATATTLAGADGTSAGGASVDGHGATAANGVDTGSSFLSSGPKVQSADDPPAVSAPNQPAVAPPAAMAAASDSGQPTRRSFAVNGAAGRLGEFSSGNVPIYRDRQSGGQRMFTAPAGTRVMVVSQVDSWYGIRMLDGSIGWAETEFLKLTDTDLVARASSGPSTQGEAVVARAEQYLGVPYVWGGTSASGLDCSGLVWRVVKEVVGASLPRTAREQIGVGTPMDLGHPELWQPGDRIYFSGGGEYIDHTGIYIGNYQFIHASGRHQMVHIDNILDPRYWHILRGVRRGFS